MTSYEVTKHLQTFLDATGPDRALVRYLFVAAKGYDAVTAELVQVMQAKSRTLFSVKQQSVQERFAELRKQADIFPLGQIFHETIELQNVVKGLLTAFDGDEAHFFGEMNRQLASFYTVFEKLVRNPTKDAFAALLPEASQLYAVVVSSRQFFSTVRKALQLQDKTAPEVERLSVLFEATTDYGAMVARLAALQDGYTELVSLVGVSAEDHPIRVVRVEAAPLWICIEGEPRTVALLTALMQRFALFWFHRAGAGEAGTASADRITATQSLVNLADELERAGIMEVTPDASHIRESALALRRVFMQLMDGETALRINDKPYPAETASGPSHPKVAPSDAPAKHEAIPAKVDIRKLAEEIALAAAG